MVGPYDVSGLNPEVEFVADVGACRSAVGSRSVPGTGVGVHGVLLTAIGSDAQHLGPSSWGPITPDGTVSEQLCLSGFTIELDSHRLAMKSPPGLDVGPINGHAARHEGLDRNGSACELGGKPLSVDPRGARLEHLAQLHEESLDTVIGLGRIPAMDIETVALLLTQGIERPGYVVSSHMSRRRSRRGIRARWSCRNRRPSRRESATGRSALAASRLS